MGAVVTFPANETALADARATLRRETVSPEELRAACNTLMLLGSPSDVELARLVMWEQTARDRLAAWQAYSTGRISRDDDAPPRRVYLSDALLVAGFFAALWLFFAVTQS
jgi:hypothetical protein